MQVSGGPWVRMALLCERVIEDKEGVLTIVRVVDRVITTVQAQGVDPPAQMPPLDYATNLVITLTAGDALGRHTVNVETEGPDGQTKPGPSFTVVFESPDRGTNLIINMQLRLEKEGLHWFNVLLEDRLLSRVPLRVVYAPTRIG